jgi:hypothetical protein
VTVELSKLWDSVARDAFRLETLQAYRVAGEEDRIQAWREGRPWPEGPTAWQRRLIEMRERGVQVRRVHVVDEPLSEYVRWEIASYQRNAAYGEDIRILLSTQAAAPHLPDQDFWVFDDDTVVLMHYDDEGRLTGRELYQGGPAPYLAARDSAWAYAQPLATWCKHWECE